MTHACISKPTQLKTHKKIFWFFFCPKMNNGRSVPKSRLKVVQLCIPEPLAGWTDCGGNDAVIWGGNSIRFPGCPSLPDWGRGMSRFDKTSAAGQINLVPTREPSSSLSSRSCPLSALPVRAQFRSQTPPALIRLFHTHRLRNSHSALRSSTCSKRTRHERLGERWKSNWIRGRNTITEVDFKWAVRFIV